MVVLFYANRDLTQRFYTKDLLEYGELQIQSLDTLIQQDLLAGFYPAVVQKTGRFMDRDDIVALRIELNDGTILFDRSKELDVRYETRQITRQVMSVVGDLADPAVNTPIATIKADLSLRRVIEQVDRQQRQLALIWSGGVLIGCILVYLVGRRISKPIMRLKEAVGTRDLVQIAGSSAVSRVTELRELEGEFSRMGTRLLGAIEHARRNEEFALIAKTTQMLAHDVRRPFSIFRAGLSLLRSVDSTNGLKEILARLEPEVERATRKVNGLITDVMEVGRPSVKLHREAIAPSELILNSLVEVFRSLPRDDLTIEYQLRCQRRVNADPIRIGRVFDNILANAVQAAGPDSKLWFHTTQIDSYCRFTIGNSGSWIPREYRLQLFQTFFTRGKIQGVGLGLAIAEKIIVSHGGTIECTSERTALMPNGFVEFQFTLPLDSDDQLLPDVILPRTSRDFDILTSMSSRTTTSDGLRSPEKDQTIGGVRLILIEDNVFLAEAWALSLKGEALLTTFTSPEEFLSACESDSALLQGAAVVLVDYHFDISAQNGLDLAAAIRAKDPSKRIILCTDRDLEPQQWMGRVDAVIPKDPVGLTVLLGL